MQVKTKKRLKKYLLQWNSTMQLLLVTELNLCNVVAYINQNNVRTAFEYCMVYFYWRYTRYAIVNNYLHRLDDWFFKWRFIFLNAFRYLYNSHFNKHFTF